MGGTTATNGGKVQPKAYDHATVFLCVPLRTAVICIGASSFFLGASLLFDRVGTEEALRPYIGGYARKSRSVLGLLDFFGLIMGPLGVAGAWSQRASHVKLFLGYQAVRLAAWAWMYFADIPLLWNCELWTKDVDKAEKLYTWNPVMFNISVQSQCQSERFWFTVCSFVSLIFAIYCVAATQRLLGEMEDEPPYLFKAPLGTSSGAFYTRSWASQSIHEQMKEQAEKEAAQAQAKLRGQEVKLLKHLGLSEDEVFLPGIAPAGGMHDPEAAKGLHPGFGVPLVGGSLPPQVAESAPAGFFRPAADGDPHARPLREGPGLQPQPQPQWSTAPAGPPPSKWVHEVL